VEKTGHLVCIDEAHPRCSIAADVSAQVAQVTWKSLRGPIEMATTPPRAPVPFSPVLEDAFIPGANAIVAAVHRTRKG
jgi:pyruvate dehydrogenase E1 component beta subunit